MLFRPASLTEFFGESEKTKPLCDAIGEMAAWTRDLLGEERLAWLRELPLKQTHGAVALVHASPDSLWRAPMPEASDEELKKVYSGLTRPIAVYAHIHRSYVRASPELTVVNTGSVSLSHDGDRRSAYLLLDDSIATIRRVEYDVDREADALSNCGLPHAEWVVRMLRSGRPQGL